MYYPLYNNPFYYPSGAYMNNMCSYGRATMPNSSYNSNTSSMPSNKAQKTRNENSSNNKIINNDIFSINGDRLDVFGISINIDDLIILIMIFFMFKENQIDYSLIIILALILFDQN